MAKGGKSQVRGEGAERRASQAAHLVSEWEWVNVHYLKGALRAPVLAIEPLGSRLGAWDAQTRTLSISLRHLEEDPWFAVVETLRHEMAHQYAHEVLGARDERAHGGAFRQACHQLRVSPAASGDGGGSPEDPLARERQRVLGRVEKLLALADSPNAHEAELAVAHARRLLLAHNLSELDLEERAFGVRQIGRTTRRKHLYEYLLANVLAEYFFVKTIWTWTYDAVRDAEGKVLQIHGTPTNLDMAEYVHEYLLTVAEQLWRVHKAERGIRSNRDRLQFHAGVMEGFESTLCRQNGQLREKALVWKGDPQLEAHYRWHHPSVRSAAIGAGSRGEAYADGVARGERVRLRKPVEGGGRNLGGLLGPG